MIDLHERLHAELDRRTAVANAATPGPWAWEATGQQDNSWGLGTVVGADGETLLSGDITDVEGTEVVDAVCYKDDGRLADAAHIALHDPASELRRYAGELKVLDRHPIVWRDIGWLEDGDTRYEELPVCGRCVPKHSHYASRTEVPTGACEEVKGVASRLGVSVQ